MISLFKKQLLMLALIAGIALPVSAMDTPSQSASIFGWKAVAGISILGAGLMYFAYNKWVKSPATELKEKTFVKVESTFKLETQEDFEREQAKVTTEIEQLEEEIAQEEEQKKPVQATVKRPKGQAGRAKPTRGTKEATQTQEVIKEELTASNPTKKPVGGQTYGVSLTQLNAIQLKQNNKK